jgi:YegS/Rv2252/BmrU family lipid kinase
VSGVGRKKVVESIVKEVVDPELIDFDIIYTKYHGHANELARSFANQVDAVVAVGGDGTVNEVGSGLVYSNTALGIIPTGSGNGLARFLDIPLKIKQSVTAINSFNYRMIDVLKVNEHYSLNVAGIGFDAYISQKFSEVKNRGPLQYMRLITKEFATYKSESYSLSIDGHNLKREAFLISFANSSQWGNNVHIAPGAQIDDGYIDVCIVADFPKYEGPALLISLLDQSIDQNKYDEIIRARKIHLHHDQPLLGHVDGEPLILGNDVDISILHLSLKVIVPPAEFNKGSVFDPLLEMLPSFPFRNI